MPIKRRKRGGPWYTVVKVDGRWERKTTGVTSKEAALRILEEREREAADPTHHAANKTTLGAMITAFLATAKRAKWAEGTREMYEQKSRHLARVLGEDTKGFV